MNAYSKVTEFLKSKTDIEKPIELISAIERVCLHTPRYRCLYR